MKKNITAADLLVYMIMAIPPIYLALHYHSLPQTIPLHFNFHGADGYGDKSQSWVFISIITLVSFAMYAFLKNIMSIDPKRPAASSASLFHKIAVMMVVFLSILEIIILKAMQGNMFSLEKLLLPCMGIFFSLLGNLMLNIKPNYFVGIRVPWTLENDDNWRKTHRLAGKLWFAGGIIAAITAILLPYKYAFICFIAIVSVITIIPVIFSYQYFRKHQTS